ncbi:MAG TPA: hypothetical protein VGB85_19770 [Nannocystis sp.]|jgi:hypothetical protein
MTCEFIARRLILSGLLVAACGGDPGGSTDGGSTGTGTSATTSGTTGEPTTTGVTTGPTSSGESGSGTQGQTDTGATSTGDASTGATGTGSTGSTGSTGEPGSSTGEPGSSSGGADLCADFVPPGCMESGCPEGQECKVLADECVSSDCTCDAGTGEIICSPDCGGGSCVPSSCECAADNDCVKTSAGCCPCNAGGQEVPAHKDCVDEVMQCDIPPDQVNCPQVYLCTDAQPACVNGQCVLL